MYNLILIYVKTINYISILLNSNVCYNNIELNSFCNSVSRLLVCTVCLYMYICSNLSQVFTVSLTEHGFSHFTRVHTLHVHEPDSIQFESQLLVAVFGTQIFFFCFLYSPREPTGSFRPASQGRLVPLVQLKIPQNRTFGAFRPLSL